MALIARTMSFKHAQKLVKTVFLRVSKGPWFEKKIFGEYLDVYRTVVLEKRSKKTIREPSLFLQLILLQGLLFQPQIYPKLRAKHNQRWELLQNLQAQTQLVFSFRQ